MGVQVCLVVARQHLPRRLNGRNRHRARQCDYMGMLATVMNALALQSVLERCGFAYAGAVRYSDDDSVRALHSPARHSSYGKGADRSVCRRHR